MTAGDGRGSALDLARRVQRIEISPTVAMAQRAAVLKAQGRPILDFSVGEPDQPTPAHISQAAIAAIGAGRTRYTASAGLGELRQAVAQRYRKDFQISFSESEVLITNGGKHALYLACQALLNRGDEVIIPCPYWPTFAEAVRLAGGRPILVSAPEKDGFRVTARLIGKATTSKTKAVILNSPSNPTGAVIDDDELLVISDMAQRRKFTILYDDTYAWLSFEGGRKAVLQHVKDSRGDRFVVIGTASKTYCMTGWRIGWILGPGSLIEACKALISHSTQNPTTFAQLGAVEALLGPQKAVQDLLGEYRRRRDYMHPALTAIPGVSCALPGGGFYLFPKLSRYLSAGTSSTIELGRRLLEEKNLAVVPGEAFGAPGFLRLSFARPMEELREGMERMALFLADLKKEA